MLNEEMRTLTLKRHDMCRISMALTHIIIDFMEEIRDPNTTETQKKIAESSLEMWKSIREEVHKQLDEQDEAD